ncbi:MAG TPA: ABC transporter permease, partial [Bacillota bacterium]|nr:ABC transporter permease [Bacillota bacterium]
GDVPMILTLLVMIFLLMAFLFTVIIKSTIEEEAPVIGTLLSLGYRRGELIRYYMSLPLLITLAAALFGNVFGYTVMKDIFLDLYYSHYSLFPFRLTLDAGAFILTSSLPLVLIAAVNFLALRQKLRFSPLRFLRRDLKKRGVRKAFRLPVLPFLSRFRLRVLLQNKVLFLVMFVGLLLANLLLLYGVSAAPIIDRYTAQLGESMPARYEYHLRGPIGSSFGGEFTVYSVQSEKNYGGRRLMITLYGYENEMPYLREYPVTPGAPEAYASRGIMEKMKLRVGDTIDLYDKYQGRPIRLKLIGQTDDANLNLHMSREALNQLMQRDSGYYNGIFSDEKLDIDERMIVRVLDSDKMEEAGRSLTLFVRKIIPPVLVVSVAIFLVVVLVLSHVIVQRSAHSICCLRVFGYTRQEIGKIYLGVTDLALIVFELVSIPAGAYLLKVSMTFAMSKFNAYIHPVAPWPYYFIPAAVGILLYQLGKALQMRRLERADLSEALKENFG